MNNFLLQQDGGKKIHFFGRIFCNIEINELDQNNANNTDILINIYITEKGKVVFEKVKTSAASKEIIVGEYETLEEMMDMLAIHESISTSEYNKILDKLGMFALSKNS
jgi:hypothetical protein